MAVWEANFVLLIVALVLTNSTDNKNVTKFVYVASIAAHFGAQIWMTFISSLALYYSLPRHLFGQCQEILFPLYFLINSLYATLTLITFAKLHTVTDTNIIQLKVLSFSLATELLSSFVITPILLHYMKYSHRKFKAIHFVCILANVIAISCTSLHIAHIKVDLL